MESEGQLVECTSLALYIQGEGSQVRNFSGGWSGAVPCSLVCHTTHT